MKILVTGSEGQLGKTLQQIAPLYPSLHFDFHDTDLDITNRQILDNYFIQRQTDCVINCAAYTAVDLAEKESQAAFRLNSDAVGILADLSSKFHFRLIHYSTDYVFDGLKKLPYNEDDIANPISIYGQSKYAGELKILSSESDAFIIRTSWLYSPYGNNFVKTILNFLRAKKELRVVFDQQGTPTYAKDLVVFTLNKILQLPRNYDYRVLHYSNEGTTNWYDFAKAISEYSGIAGSITPVESKDYFQLAKRPFFGVLNKELVKKICEIEIPDWQVSLKLCIQEILSE